MRNSTKDSNSADKTKELAIKISELIEPVCRDHLDDEYLELTRRLINKLARKRPSPLLKGKVEIWACAIIYALGQVNFLFDKTQKPHLKPKVLCELFGVKPTTAKNKARIISELFKMGPLAPRWTCPSRLDNNPVVWLIEDKDGFVRDIRNAPREEQAIAYSMGLIPYIPDDKKKKSSDDTTDPDKMLFSMEKFLQGLTPQKDKDPLSEAQNMMYDAWELDDSKTRISIAFDALKISRDCADAWTLLANEIAEIPVDAVNYYMLAVSAGERAIGEKVFKEEVGNFWGILETRPYMRALSGMAQLCFDLGDLDKAINIYNDLLRLNPNDNQGNRYMLASALLENRKMNDLRRLIGKYDEKSTFWAYSQAIVAFAKYRDKKKSREILHAAFKENIHVPEYLLYPEKMPDENPGFYSPGDRAEALIYAENSMMGWENIKGALSWLKNTLKEYKNADI
ncbi:MAG: hypothetical protein J7M30_00125 [Deltaproteobacteria bacterium]|nr:hypothetical protein [Deltaproteobacteria bacterium]